MREVFFSFFDPRFEKTKHIWIICKPPLPSPLFSLLSLKQHFLYSIPSIPITLVFSAYSSPSLGFSFKIRFWSVAMSGEEKRGKEKGRDREDAKGVGEGKRGRKGMREKGMRKPVAVINSAFFLHLKFSHLSHNLLPLDQVCISLSLVPSRPVPSRPVFFHYPFFPSSLHAFSISPHALSPPFLSFPFLSFPITPLPHYTLHPPPTLVHPPPFYHLHQHQVIPALTHEIPVSL